MCGITGIAAADFLGTDERTALRRMRDALSHRGPDDAGQYFDLHAALGHRRLAIVDVEGGRQPVCNERGNVWAVLNGQIYNHAALRDELRGRGHVFATRGDAEVVTHLYEEFGDRFLTRLNGMFAVAVWDAARRRLLLARDRMGVKPLYYIAEPRRVIFGSELKSLLEAPGVPREIDVQGLADYLALGYVPSPRTIYRGIRKLQPGEYLIFEQNNVHRHTWWSLPAGDWHTAPEVALADELWERLTVATRDRVATEVPCGAFLSGGVDSAAVTALLQQAGGAGEGLKTFAIGMDDAALDERGAARESAARLGTDHGEAVLTADDARLLPRLAWHFDEPLADPSALPLYRLAEMARPHMKVALTGDGGDEILAGYRRYRFDVNEDRVRQVAPAWLRAPVFAAAARLAPDAAWLPRPMRARRTLENLAGDAADGHARSVARMDLAAVRALLHPDLRRALGDYDPLEQLREAYRKSSAEHPLARAQAVDIRYGLGDGILTKADRASMAHGLELRSPMLDHRFVEFAARIPPGSRMRGPMGKWLLRCAVEKRVDAGIARRSKQGFGVPLDRWFGEPRGRLSRMVARATLGGAGGLLDEATIAALVQDQRSGRRAAGATLWSIAMLGAWAAQFLPEAKRGGPAARPKTVGSPLRIQTAAARADEAAAISVGAGHGGAD